MNEWSVIDKTTGTVADEYEIALKEKWAERLCYCDMEGFAILEDGSLILCDECGRFEYCDPERFKVVEDSGEWKGYNIKEEWKRNDGSPVFLQCSVCGGIVLHNGSGHWNYCPNCGRPMEAWHE